jgi:tRNA threonylcarbamoyladenosine biosynthesis protein TsaB
MKILAFDTTAKVASVAVLEDGRALAEYSVDNGLTQSELILPMAEDILRKLKLDFSDIELYAVTTGPGSFTGVRIGVSLVKGLAFGRSTSIVEVSTLEALAENISPLNGILVPCMDARRGEVYNAIFSSDGECVSRITDDRAVSLEALAEELSRYVGERKIYLSGDGYTVARRALLAKGLKIEATPPLLINENAASVGRVAYRKFLSGNCVTDSELSPSYLRLPQAERERLEREKSSVRS